MPSTTARTAIPGFSAQDFAVFSIPGFAERMEGVKLRVRPKLEAIGEALAPELSQMLGIPIYAHVAKHMRRTVNPPKDTWVAFSANARGYKAHPHFQVGLWEDHLFAQFALIYESPDRARFARQLREHLGEITEGIPDDFRWSLDHTRPEGTLQRDFDGHTFDLFLGKVEKLKGAEALCGLDLPASDPRVRDGKKLLPVLRSTFQTLKPLFRLAQ